MDTAILSSVLFRELKTGSDYNTGVCSGATLGIRSSISFHRPLKLGPRNMPESVLVRFTGCLVACDVVKIL